MEDKPNDQRQHVRGLWCLKLWQWHGAVATKAMKHYCLAACSGGGDTGGREGCVDDDGRGAKHRRPNTFLERGVLRKKDGKYDAGRGGGEEAAAAATRGIGIGWLIVV